MRLVRDKAPCPGACPVAQARIGDLDHLGRKIGHVDAVDLGLKPVFARGHMQRLALFRAPAFDQVPGGIQRRLVIGQPDPEGRQGAQTAPGAAIRAAHLDELLHPRLGEDGGQVVGPVGQGRNLSRQGRKVALQEIAEGLAKRVDVLAVAVDEIHRHIEDILHPGLEPEAFVEDKGDHAGAGIVQMPPDIVAIAFHAVRLALEEGRIGEERIGHRLQRHGDAHLLDHVRLGGEIQVHLNRTGPAHHDLTGGADVLHIGVHQLVPPLGHQGHVFMRPVRRGPQPDEAHANLVGNVLHVAQVVVHLVAGLVDRLKRRARQFQLTTRF